ncbi:hypothetical protein RHIZO_01738 [Rhizobiaceae bacterium]|nr:hypothetical protein RHIZO_01738 [Rhizobiaceae bacterium]
MQIKAHERTRPVRRYANGPALVLLMAVAMQTTAMAMGGKDVMASGTESRLEAVMASSRRVTFHGQGDGASYFGGVWLHFGDGENAMFCRPGSGCRENTLEHTYARAGTYEAELVGVGEGTNKVLGAVTVTVAD